MDLVNLTSFWELFRDTGYQILVYLSNPLRDSVILDKSISFVSLIISSLSLLVGTILTIYFYKKQKNQQKASEFMISQQRHILEELTRTRVNHIRWFTHHTKHNLEVIEQYYNELKDEIERYQTSKDQLILRKIISKSKLIQEWYKSTISLFERDLAVSKDYLSSPYFVGKFSDVLNHLLQFSNYLPQNEEHFLGYTNYDTLLDYVSKDLMQINTLKGYIEEEETIYKKLTDLNNTDKSNTE